MPTYPYGIFNRMKQNWLKKPTASKKFINNLK